VRAEFSTMEAAAQAVFDILQYLSTIIFTRPEMFKIPVLMSCGSVWTALIIYSWFVRKRRGHLLHLYIKFVDKEGSQNSQGP